MTTVCASQCLRENMTGTITLTHEWFIVLEGELLIDFKDKETAVLKANDSLLIPKGTIHRTRSYVRTVNLCVEHTRAKTVITEERHADQKDSM